MNMRIVGLVLSGCLILIMLAIVGYKVLAPQTKVNNFVANSVSVVCRVMVEGKIKYVATIKDQKIRVNSFPSKEYGKVEVLIKDSKVWIWWEGGTAGALIKADAVGIDEEINDSLSKNKGFCQQDSVSEPNFEAPVTVVFK